MGIWLKRLPKLLAVLAVSALLCSLAQAQGPREASATTGDAASAPLPNAPSSGPSSDDVWHFTVAPYVWFPGMHGTVGALNHNASVHLTGTDVISALNFGFMGLLEARKNRLVIPIDLLWAKLATTHAVPENDRDQTQVRLTIRQGIFTPKIGYRIVDGEKLKVDSLFGIRIWHLGQNITLRPSQYNQSVSANWVDAVAGGRFILNFSPKAWITVSGDAGGGGAKLDYQGVGIFNIQPKPKFGFFLGWRYTDVNYVRNTKLFIFDVAQTGPLAGLNFQFGGKPPVPPSASCSISPSEIWAGDPVTANITPQNFNPKHPLAYNWSSTGGKASGTAANASVDTTGLAPGTYSVTGTATDTKEKKNNAASCHASFTVKQPHPPQASCSANPSTVKPGDTAQINASASSPDNFPLTYAWSSDAGTISGTGASATLNTAGAASGSNITSTATVTDSRGLSTTCNATVAVLAPPPPPVTVSEVSEVGECKFTDTKRLARVDNVCKAVLDDVALRIQREPNGTFVIVGYTAEEEKVTVTQLGAQRSVNIKYYLVNGEGGSQIDATRLDVRTSGTVKDKAGKIYFVPSGATFTEESMAVDETKVKGQSRSAPKKKTSPAPAQ